MLRSVAKVAPDAVSMVTVTGSAPSVSVADERVMVSPATVASSATVLVTLWALTDAASLPGASLTAFGSFAVVGSA